MNRFILSVSTFFSFLCLLSTPQSQASEAELYPEQQCIEQVRSSAVNLIDRAMQNGYTKINRVSLEKLKNDIVTEKIPTFCNLILESSMTGRRSAFYTTSKDVKNTPGLLVNYILITKHALEAPLDIQGLLLIHETLGALNYNDFAYSYTLPLYFMAEGTFETPSDVQRGQYLTAVRLASSEGTSTGVGGGDWRTLQLKIGFYKKLQEYLTQSQLSLAEKKRQLAFFSTLMIDFERDSYFDKFVGDAIAAFAKFETGPDMGCSTQRAFRLLIRESKSESIMKSEINSSRIFSFLVSRLQNAEYGNNAFCIP